MIIGFKFILRLLLILCNGECLRIIDASTGLNLDDGTVSLPIKFKAPQVGHYTCRVVLRSANDIRLYHLEVSVSPEGTTALLEFACPAQQTVVQEIPIVNNTDSNWFLQAFLKGESFSGPQTIAAPANQTTLYPLTFKPQFEGGSEGTLRLVNKTDGMEHCFSLVGFGERPLALDHFVVNCTVKRKTGYMVRVPNTTARKQSFNVTCLHFFCLCSKNWCRCFFSDFVGLFVFVGPWSRDSFAPESPNVWNLPDTLEAGYLQKHLIVCCTWSWKVPFFLCNKLRIGLERFRSVLEKLTKTRWQPLWPLRLQFLIELQQMMSRSTKFGSLWKWTSLQVFLKKPLNFLAMFW